MNKKTPSESTKEKHQEKINKSPEVLDLIGSSEEVDDSLHKEVEFLLGALEKAKELGRKYRMEKNSNQKKIKK